MAGIVQNKVSDVRTKTPDELKDLLLGLRKEQFNLRFQRAAGQNEGIARVKQVRREIARVKTIVAQKRAQSIVAQKRAQSTAAEKQASSASKS